jgi:uncharacterized protein YodC (DUF2158 family)
MATGGNPAKVNAGDVVRLNCGGPLMAADWVDTSIARPVAHCVWIDGRDKVHSAFFNLDVLERASPDAQASGDFGLRTGKDGRQR